MNDYTQIERLVRILQILSSGQKITTKKLLDRFERQISLRTIQRDLIALGEAGIPLVSEKISANENVWYISSRFRSFVPIPLNTSEYLAAHILRSNLKIFRKTPLDTEIKSLVNKIDQLVPDDIFLDLDRKKAWDLFENYSAGLFDYGPFGEIIDDLVSSILNSERCYVKYRSAGAEEFSNFYIEPEKLVYYNGGLYIIAFMRHYKRFILLSIQRIRKLKLSGKKFVRDHPFNPEQFWSSRFGLFPGEREEVILVFSSDVADYIDGRTWHSSQEMKRYNSGDLKLKMKVALSPELVSWIMSWHRYVKVQKPTALVDLIRKAAADINALY